MRALKAYAEPKTLEIVSKWEWIRRNTPSDKVRALAVEAIRLWSRKWHDRSESSVERFV